MDDEGSGKVAMSFRFPREIVRLIRALADRLGTTQAGVVAVAIRELARRYKID